MSSVVIFIGNLKDKQLLENGKLINFVIISLSGISIFVRQISSLSIKGYRIFHNLDKLFIKKNVIYFVARMVMK